MTVMMLPAFILLIVVRELDVDLNNKDEGKIFFLSEKNQHL